MPFPIIPIAAGIACAVILGGCGNVRKTDAFNGARAEVSRKRIHLKSEDNTDAGVAIAYKGPLKGYLHIKVSGYTTSSKKSEWGPCFSIIFIKAVSPSEYEKDSRLKEFEVSKIDKIKREYKIAVPQGTNKINYMLVGTGSMDIKIEDIGIAE
jgi:hypothetical protein